MLKLCVISSFRIALMVKEPLLFKDVGRLSSPNKLMNFGAVFRTAPATPGQSIIHPKNLSGIYALRNV